MTIACMCAQETMNIGPIKQHIVYVQIVHMLFDFGVRVPVCRQQTVAEASCSTVVEELPKAWVVTVPLMAWPEMLHLLPRRVHPRPRRLHRPHLRP